LLDRIGFLKMQTSPGTFLQVNLWTARRIYETVLEWVVPREGDAVVDLFAGAGPLSLYLATGAARVVGVEEVPWAVKDARSNARRNGFHNIRFREGAAEEALPQLVEELGRADIVTLNPPRKGALAEVIQGIAGLEPRRIAYVSCNPDTLARDLDRLAALGYRTLRLRPFDMMPQTEHVETVALMERS
jgi:23S rRNA (uracil1939-C5)-methyltransferase